MTNQHPIIPPPELARKWCAEGVRQDCCTVPEYIAVRAAQWGADTELKACCEWTTANFGELPGKNLRLFRRPNQPSLKQQALELLDKAEALSCYIDDFSIVRRALERLDG